MTEKRIPKDIRRVVVKIGTMVISHKDGSINSRVIGNLVAQVARLRERGVEICIVSSGAIGAGMCVLGYKKRPSDLASLQACAAVGQGILVQHYAARFKKFGIGVAQILLTAEDFRSRHRFLNIRNTFLHLFSENIVPIVNENDTVAVDEIKFGDNDRLSALVTSLIYADLLIMLTTVDGLYRIENDKKMLIEEITRIPKPLKDLCYKKEEELSVGGMLSKLQAAQMVMEAGEYVVIANGKRKNIIEDIIAGDFVGTLLKPVEGRLASRKRWIAYFSRVNGKVFIDDGAKEALLKRKKSLLPGVVIMVEGHFSRGDVVSIVDKDGVEIARGLVNYNAREAERIKGLRTTHIPSILGYKGDDELVHRDNMVINSGRSEQG